MEYSEWHLGSKEGLALVWDSGTRCQHFLGALDGIL